MSTRTNGPKGTRLLRGRRRGYTVVEVMSAMTLFAIGAAGVITMQRVTIQGGEDARRMDVATNIANEWSFRLSRDAAFWTLPSASNQDTNNINLTAWLKDAPTTATTTTAWITADLAEPRGKPAFDLWGRDRGAGTGDHMFCTQHRFSWLTFVGSAAPFRTTALLRTEVRVIWARLDNGLITNCSTLPATPDPNQYHFVYVVSAVRPAPAP